MAPAGTADSGRKSIAERTLSLMAEVRAGEGAGVLLLALNVFLLLASYYFIRPVRNALILTEGGAEVKSYAAAGQALLLLGVLAAAGSAHGAGGGLPPPVYTAKGYLADLVAAGPTAALATYGNDACRVRFLRLAVSSTPTELSKPSLCSPPALCTRSATSGDGPTASLRGASVAVGRSPPGAA